MTATFAELLQTLPPVDHLAALELLDASGHTVARLENKPGSAGSVRVYAALAAEYGSINAAAAARGLELFAEHTAAARAHPGSHPNIDRLLQLIGTTAQWQVRSIPANS
ncbi:MAG: DUF2322 family protein [Rhodoferax sp.]|nr:MAG: DUF2322 family protein [Rhodoferax sp.]